MKAAVHSVPSSHFVPATAPEALCRVLERSAAILEFAPDGAILSANTQYLTLSGYSQEELIGKNHRVLCPAEDVMAEVYREYWEQLRSGRRHSGLRLHRRKDGSDLWLEAVYCTAFSATGETECITKLCIDVSERMAAFQEKTVRMDATDRALIMAEYSPHGAFTGINENFLITLGYSERELIGKQVYDMFALSSQEECTPQSIWDSIRSGHTHTQLCRWTSEDGAPVCLETSFTPVFSPDGEIQKVIQLAFDVTSRVAADQEYNDELRRRALIADTTGNAVAMTDNTNKTIYVNAGFVAMFGYTERELRRRSPTCVFGPAEKSMLSRIKRGASSRTSCHTEEVAFCKNGRRLWVSFLANPVFDAQGKLTHIVHVFTDITDTKLDALLQQKMLEAMSHDVPAADVLSLVCREVERILPDVHVAILKKDILGHQYLFASPGLPPYGMKRGESLPPGRGTDSGAAVTVYDIGTSTLDDDAKAHFSAVGIRACMAKAVLSGAGRVLGTVAFCYYEHCEPDALQQRLADTMTRLCAIVLEREEARAAMRMLTFYDPVTCLPNRDLLLAGAEQAISTISPHFEMPFAVLCINVDRFNRINISCGYEAGNEALKTVAKRLAEIKGAEDIVGHMTADEFVMFAANCDAERALHLARRIQSALSAPCRVKDVNITLSATIGISLYPDNGRNVEHLVAHAGAAMLLGKRHGQGQLRFFSEELNTRTSDSLSLESRLCEAIEYGKLHVHYQPQINMQTGQLYGVEALCRWSDSGFGDISPARFIPLAEEAGLIAHLSDWVLRETCRQLGLWRAEGLFVPTISINLSASNFHDIRLPDTILACLAEYGLEPGDLMLELTESVLLDNDPVTMTTIRKAHQLGLLLSLDDFGTGYSSLSYLRHLPISEIKLDQSFVRDLHNNEVSQRLSQAVMHIAESLNLAVLAEGIENHRQFSILKQQRYHAAQGYLVSKPLPPQEFSTWLKNWKPIGMHDQYVLA